ncbi:organic cation transporter protein-like isoform X2 [Symsagittifera roscoffensis]|uniref:organic cation transporter protein-like isoform X2 n=1 Tax=Symsagittifera roscoffensis TaxID=84072 RepID=UPI00307C613F
MKSDALFLAIGEFGRFQVLTILFLTMLGIIGHSDFLTYTLFYNTPEHTCVIPKQYLDNETRSLISAQNSTVDQAFQYKGKDDDELLDTYCNHYITPYLPLADESEPETVKCSEWEFNKGLVYVFMDWTHFEMTLGICGLLMLLVLKYCFESPLWLISKGLETQAEYVLLRIAEINKRTVPTEHMRNFIAQALSEEYKSSSVQSNGSSQSASAAQSWTRYLNVYFIKSKVSGKLEDLRIFVKSYPNICIKGILFGINWCVVSAGFYAIFFSVPNLGGDKYFNIFLISVIDYPMYFFCYLFMERFGRKFAYLLSMVAGGMTGLLIMIFRHSDIDGMVTALSLFGAMCFSSCYTIIYIWTSEVFPTPIRNSSMGFCSLCGRIGMSAVPFFLLLGVAAEATMCMLAFGAAILASMLPETNKVQLPQALQEGEKVGLSVLPGGLRSFGVKVQSAFRSKYNRESLIDETVEVEQRRTRSSVDGNRTTQGNGELGLEVVSTAADIPDVSLTSLREEDSPELVFVPESPTRKGNGSREKGREETSDFVVPTDSHQRDEEDSSTDPSNSTFHIEV